MSCATPLWIAAATRGRGTSGRRSGSGRVDLEAAPALEHAEVTEHDQHRRRGGLQVPARDRVVDLGDALVVARLVILISSQQRLIDPEQLARVRKRPFELISGLHPLRPGDPNGAPIL